MAFLDDIGKKISVAGQTAMQKAKNISDSSRIREEISEHEKRLQRYYYEVGKIYLCHHYNNYEEDFAEIIPLIIDSETQLRDLRKQLNSIEKAGKCENCGAVLIENAKFCTVCGKPVQKPVPAEGSENKCPICGATISEELSFCTSCGTKLK